MWKRSLCLLLAWKEWWKNRSVWHTFLAASNIELDEIIVAEKRAHARIYYANHKSPLLACRTLPRIVICCAEWLRVNQTASVNSHRLPNPRDFSHRFLAACVRIRSLRAGEKERERERAARRCIITVFFTNIFLNSFNVGPREFASICDLYLLTVVNRYLHTYMMTTILFGAEESQWQSNTLSHNFIIFSRLDLNIPQFFPFVYSFMQIIHFIFSHKRKSESMRAVMQRVSTEGTVYKRFTFLKVDETSSRTPRSLCNILSEWDEERQNYFVSKDTFF